MMIELINDAMSAAVGREITTSRRHFFLERVLSNMSTVRKLLGISALAHFVFTYDRPHIQDSCLTAVPFAIVSVSIHERPNIPPGAAPAEGERVCLVAKGLEPVRSHYVVSVSES